MNCPKCGFIINAGSELARLGKGVKKSFSKAERLRRSELMKRIRQNRKAKSLHHHDGKFHPDCEKCRLEKAEK